MRDAPPLKDDEPKREGTQPDAASAIGVQVLFQSSPEEAILSDLASTDLAPVRREPGLDPLTGVVRILLPEGCCGGDV